jgi:hypothetical protein
VRRSVPKATRAHAAMVLLDPGPRMSPITGAGREPGRQHDRPETPVALL